MCMLIYYITDQNTTAFKEVAIIRHPRLGEYAFGFITSTVVLQVCWFWPRPFKLWMCCYCWILLYMSILLSFLFFFRIVHWVSVKVEKLLYFTNECLLEKFVIILHHRWLNLSGVCKYLSIWLLEALVFFINFFFFWKFIQCNITPK